MDAAAAPAADVRARVVRTWVRSLRKVARSCASGPMRPWSGPRSTPARARWVHAASADSWRNAVTRSGPAVWGRRSSDRDWPTAADARPGDLLGCSRQVLHRAQLATGHRNHVDRPEQGGGQEVVRRAEAGRGRVEGPDRGAGQDSVGGEALPGRLDGRLALVDVLSGQHHLHDGGDRPDHHERHDDDDDLPPCGAARARRAARPRDRRQVGLGARIARLAVVHRGERTAGVAGADGHPARLLEAGLRRSASFGSPERVNCHAIVASRVGL